MNSLEWVDAEITKWQEILESFKEQLIQVKGTRNEQTTLNHIEFYELRLKYLHQIKTELEAWYVVKNNTMGNNYLYEIVIYKSEKEDYEKFEKALEMNKNE